MRPQHVPDQQIYSHGWCCSYAGHRHCCRMLTHRHVSMAMLASSWPSPVGAQLKCLNGVGTPPEAEGAAWHVEDFPCYRTICAHCAGRIQTHASAGYNTALTSAAQRLLAMAPAAALISPKVPPPAQPKDSTRASSPRADRWHQQSCWIMNAPVAR